MLNRATDIIPDEIEITAEMIAAGSAELAFYSPEVSSREDCAADIYRVMALAKGRVCPSGASERSSR
jgi:hypothetical protein